MTVRLAGESEQQKTLAVASGDPGHTEEGAAPTTKQKAGIQIGNFTT